MHDTVGNVFEWVEDCKHETYKDALIDGSAWLSASGGDCEGRVLRGGSWNVVSRDLRSASRELRINATFRFLSIGFRIARTLSQ